MVDFNFIAQGSGFPLVFQHGLTANNQQIANLLGDLEDIQLISMDCPGHGSSPLTNNYKPSFRQYAKDLVQLIREQKVGRAIYGGLSMGAGISLNIAVRYPEMVKGLILLRPAWLWDEKPPNLLPILEASSLIGAQDYLGALQNLPSFRAIQSSVPLAAQSILGIFKDRQQPQLPTVIESMVHDKPISSMDELDGLDIPCLIIVNENDPLHPVEIGEVLHEKMKHSFLVKVASRYLEPELHRTQIRQHIADYVRKTIEI